MYFLPVLAFSQETGIESVVEKIVDEIVEAGEAEVQPDALYDDLISLSLTPLNINTADYADLAGLYMITDFQIQSLLQYRREFGDFKSLSELLFVPGFDQALMAMMEPFVSVEVSDAVDRLNIKNALTYGRHQFFLRTQRVLETQEGYAYASDSLLTARPNARYLGSPLRYYSRYGYNYRNQLRFGFTAEKDPGEEFFSGSNPYGFDYYSGYLQVNDAGFIKTIVIGDFQARFGQGLALWSGFSFSKSPMAINIKKTPMGISKYSSTDENRFFRGAAVTASLTENADFTFFYSLKNIDANLADTDSLVEDVPQISALQATGMHATPATVADEDAIREQFIGGNLTYNALNFRTGLTVSYQKINAEFEPDNNPADKFSSPGNENLNLGIDYHFLMKGVSFFGEAALSGNGSMALISGMHYRFNPQIAVAALYRNYSRQYYTPVGAGFGERAATNNEKGFYTGLELVPIKNMKVSAYFDVFKFPWLKFRTNAPSMGMDYLVQADYAFSKKFRLYTRYKKEIKEENAAIETSGIDYLAERFKTHYRIHYNYQAFDWLSIGNRVEISHYEKEQEKQKGMLLYQDIKLHPLPLLDITLRYALFDTEGFESRIYTYEHNVLYSFSIPALFDEGSRFYMLVKYSPLPYLDLWARYAVTSYTQKKEISSGLNRIAGNKRSDISVQVRLKF